MHKYSNIPKKISSSKKVASQRLTCRLLVLESFNPFDKIGIINGSTLSPSFLTSSPNDLPATWKYTGNMYIMFWPYISKAAKSF